MKPLLSHPRLWTARQRVTAWLLLPVLALTTIVLSFTAGSASSPPNIQSIALAADPLYATTSGDKPGLALALSVEFPTVGAQYTTTGGAADVSYSNLNEYLGYYDAESCYTYVDNPTETPASGQTASDYKRFKRSGPATNRMCADAFSGNFLNWSSSSAIDMLRLALSGGDRYIDLNGLTILQRAVIPNGNPICMWNSPNFPPKQLQKAGGASGQPYWGAVPQQMVTAAGANDIFVANTLNQIYFGTSQGGSCGNTGSYTLSAKAITSTSGSITSYSGPPPSDLSSSCAGENGTCNFTGVKEVWYGAKTSWKYTVASNTISCSNGVFGDPVVGTVKACYTRTPTTSPTTGAGLNSDGFFYSRVQVCDKDSSGALADSRDYNFCIKYPSGNYKPTGAIQKYSDQLRLAAFGYLLDQRSGEVGTEPIGHFGGVLRAPMKYVGSKTFDINGIENTPTGGNPKAEWSTQTGIYTVNPEGDTTFGISGVLNYLNKFGRTGTPGIYKKFDPVSELYYETLRYLQGLQPTANSIGTNDPITTAMYDGFPAYTTWTDPYGDGRSSTGKYSCLKSNIVVIGDINTHDGNRWPGADVANNIPNLGTWTSVVQNFEYNNVTNYTDGQGVTRQTGNPNGSNKSAPGNAIVGYAYWAHTHDIRGTDWTAQPSMQRPGLRVKSFLFDVNEYGAGSNPNNRRYSNQFFTAAKYGGFESDPSVGNGKPFNTFGNPFKQQDGTWNNNVWQKTDAPGEASTYYLQSNARDELNAFDEIFSRATTSLYSIAGAAVASKALTTAGSTVYQGAFDTSNWSGDLLAFPLTVSGSTVSVSNVADWSASEQLAKLASPSTSRNIVVGVANGAALNFDWTTISGQDSTLKDALNQLSPTAVPDGLGSDRVAFLRGSNAKEGAPFRQRNNKLLGDIVNSGVVYSGAPLATINSSTYGDFVATVTGTHARTPAVFVGANDGMLHAFNANSAADGGGVELFGYIPSWMGPKLSALTDPNYVSNHQAYVDAPPVVGEAQVRSAGNGSDWATVLVSGTGGGGRGVFALDVTHPESFAASNVMWEFTQNDDPDMGFVVGQPQLLKFRTSAPGDTPTYKWFAVVASGVNNYTAANASGVYGSGNPALFLLDLSHTVGTAWTQGTASATGDYYKISLPVNATLAQTVATGAVNFKAAISSAGTQEVRQIYVGDLHGNMWKLDFSTHGTTEWNMNKLSAFANAGTPYPLYTAKDSAGNVQPITMAPTLVASADNPNGTQVAFGTGKYLEVGDRSSTAVNSFYVIYDNATATADSSAPADAISGRNRLQQGTITAGTGGNPDVVDVAPFTWGRPLTAADTTQRAGWFIDFSTTGERQVSGATISGNLLVFGSLIPATAGDASACGVSGGSGNEYRINVDTGDGQRSVSQVGVLGQPLVLDLAQAAFTVSDSTGRRTKTITSQVIDSGSSGIATGSGSSGQTTRTVVAGRLSWRQINNYLELKNAP